MRWLRLLVALLSLSALGCGSRPVATPRPAPERPPAAPAANSLAARSFAWSLDLTDALVPTTPLAGHFAGHALAYPSARFRRIPRESRFLLRFQGLNDAGGGFGGGSIARGGCQTEVSLFVAAPLGKGVFRQSATRGPTPALITAAYRVTDERAREMRADKTPVSCILQVEQLTRRHIARCRLALCFDDSTKSWLAGRIVAWDNDYFTGDRLVRELPAALKAANEER